MEITNTRAVFMKSNQLTSTSLYRNFNNLSEDKSSLHAVAISQARVINPLFFSQKRAVTLRSSQNVFFKVFKHNRSVFLWPKVSSGNTHFTVENPVFPFFYEGKTRELRRKRCVREKG